MRIALLQPRFGPYHVARLEMLRRCWPRDRAEVIGLQVTDRDLYDWTPLKEVAGSLLTGAEGVVYEKLPGSALRRIVHGLLERTNPDVLVVNGWGYRDARAGIEWMGRRGKKVVLCCDSKADDAPRHWAKEWVKRRIVGTADAAFCSGTASRAYLEQLGMARSRIWDGVDCVDNGYFAAKAEACRMRPDEGPSELLGQGGVFLAVARFVARKNIAGLVRGYSRYCSQVQDSPWALVVLGDGSQRTELESLAAENSRGRVHFPGFKQYAEIPSWYARASCFVHTALQDQWALVVNEAMACGLPVLVSDRAGCARDLVSDGRNGWRFNPEDIEALAERMLAVHRLPAVERQEMGTQSRAIIAEWGEERFCRSLWSCVMAACDRAARKRGLRASDRWLLRFL